jgi:ribosomal protein S19E (S16A)
MKTYQIQVVDEADSDLVTKILQTLEQRGLITFHPENQHYSNEKTTPATDEQVQEIIEEAELGPFYSEKEAKNILNL